MCVDKIHHRVFDPRSRRKSFSRLSGRLTEIVEAFGLSGSHWRWLWRKGMPLRRKFSIRRAVEKWISGDTSMSL